MKIGVVGFALLLAPCGFAQVIDNKHLSLQINPSLRVSFLGMTDLKAARSWDINGKLLPKMIGKTLGPSGKKMLPNARRFYAIVEVATVRSLLQSSQHVMFFNISNGMLPGFGGISNPTGPTQVIQYPVPLDDAIDEDSSTISFYAKIASGSSKVYGAYKATASKVTHTGYAFDPKVYKSGGAEQYYVGNPPADMGLQMPKPKAQYELEGFDENGAKLNLSWIVSSTIPPNTLPFGSGKVKSLKLMQRPWVKVRFKNIPLKPKK